MPSTFFVIIVAVVWINLLIHVPGCDALTGDTSSRHHASWYFWFSLTVIILAVSVGAFSWMIFTEGKRKKESATFFQEAEAQLGYHVPVAEIEAYDRMRESAWKEHDGSVNGASEGTHECEEIYDIDYDEDPVNSWLRTISSEKRKVLKALLLKRAISNVPRWDQIARDVEGKFRLYKSGIISEGHWQMVDQAQNDLKAELELIQFEAECLEESWGETILKNAVMFYKYQKEKEAEKRAKELAEKEKEKELKQRQRMIEHQQLVDRQQQEKQQRVADRMAEALLKEETSGNKKAPHSNKKSAKDL